MTHYWDQLMVMLSQTHVHTQKQTQKVTVYQGLKETAVQRN